MEETDYPKRKDMTLARFLLSLGEDPVRADRFIEDPREVMEEAGLPSEEQEEILIKPAVMCN